MRFLIAAFALSCSSQSFDTAEPEDVQALVADIAPQTQPVRSRDAATREDVGDEPSGSGLRAPLTEPVASQPEAGDTTAADATAPVDAGQPAPVAKDSGAFQPEPDAAPPKPTCPTGQKTCGELDECVGFAYWNGCGSPGCTACPTVSAPAAPACIAQACDFLCTGGSTRCGNGCVHGTCES